MIFFNKEIRNIEGIARICHEANRAYCQMLDDHSQVAWNDAPQWQRMSAMNGVQFNMLNPNASTQEVFEAWKEKKYLDGWRYGKVIDDKKKEHPCIVPYEQLPAQEKKKDELFKAIVRVLVDFPK